MHNKKIAIIGAGNMGGCLLGGLITNHYPTSLLWISNPTETKLKNLHEQYNYSFNSTQSNLDAANSADIIIFAVKPLILPKVLSELANIIAERKPLLISTAAGVSVSIMEYFLKKPSAVVRAMPNTPAMINCGVTALYANNQVTQSEHELAETIFRTVGMIVWLKEENLIDVATAVSGSGPAYFFYMMDSLKQAGTSLGLSEEAANLLTLQTAYGAARMALESDKSVNELRAQVTSKGGTTEEAIKIMEQSNIQEIFFNAVRAANARAKELANILTKEME